jgi:hypothetical protein
LLSGWENPLLIGGPGGIMNRHNTGITRILGILALSLGPAIAVGQVAVPEVEEISEIPLIAQSEIEEIVGPIALYPDDLLAIVLPASTFPLQIVEAGRFLDALENDPSLEPDEDWDDSIVALLNYPEVIELMNEDLDWTWRLGEAVVGQQSDVIAAIETFRDRAYAAGNLKTDDYQLVAEEDGAIQITPVQEDVIYVPYYEPSQVVVYQPRPVYYYYPRPYPVYYYPYPTYYSFNDHFYHHWFWGVTTAFSIAWHTHHLSVYHHSFYGHPYYGHTYWDRWWYRRPDIHVYNNVYVRNNVNVSTTRYRNGDYWMPSNRRTVNHSDQRITRTRYYPNADTPGRPSSTPANNSTRIVRTAKGTAPAAREIGVSRRSAPEKIQFQPRPTAPASNRAGDKPGSGFSPRPGSEPGASTGRSTFKPSAAPRSTTPRTPAKTPTSVSRQSTSRPSPAASRPAARPQTSIPRQSLRPSSPAANPGASAKPRVSVPSQSARPSPSTSRPSFSRQSSAPRPSPSSTPRSSSSRPVAKPAPSRSRTAPAAGRASQKQAR